MFDVIAIIFSGLYYTAINKLFITQEELVAVCTGLFLEMVYL